MKLHNLKLKRQFWEDVFKGKKLFEIRKDDRDYDVGDLINFKLFVEKESGGTFEYDPEEKVLFEITYVLRNVPEYGLKKGYCILGIRKKEV